MKLLIGASSSKIFHLNEFAKNLKKNNVETKVVFDSDYADGFPNRKISKWFSSNKKFTSFSITAIMKSPSVIIKKYKIASKINGIISL